jgi:hypothetical protein
MSTAGVSNATASGQPASALASSLILNHPYPASSHLFQILACLIYAPPERLWHKTWVIKLLKQYFSAEVASKDLKFPDYGGFSSH